MNLPGQLFNGRIVFQNVFAVKELFAKALSAVLGEGVQHNQIKFSTYEEEGKHFLVGRVWPASVEVELQESEMRFAKSLEQGKVVERIPDDSIFTSARHLENCLIYGLQEMFAEPISGDVDFSVNEYEEYEDDDEDHEDSLAVGFIEITYRGITVSYDFIAEETPIIEEILNSG